MRRVAGFTLLEMIVVVAIIGILATLVVVRYTGKTDEAKVAAAKSQIAQIESAIVSFYTHAGRMPKELRELIEKPSGVANWQEGGYLKGKAVPKDPWGNDFRYAAQGRKFTLTSLGADGKEGGAGLDADLSNE
ncbi:MAG TPA: type II secretion system major pseudopilin GspG [Planctomycetota bacterium]